MFHFCVGGLDAFSSVDPLPYCIVCSKCFGVCSSTYLSPSIIVFILDVLLFICCCIRVDSPRQHDMGVYGVFIIYCTQHEFLWPFLFLSRDFGRYFSK